MPTLSERLADDRVIIADGATGTFLQRSGLPRGTAPERWNLENPDAILDLHRSYLAAGAELATTNSFGGTRFRLDGHGLAGRLAEVNRRAAELAHGHIERQARARRGLLEDRRQQVPVERPFRVGCAARAPGARRLQRVRGLQHGTKRRRAGILQRQEVPRRHDVRRPREP